MNREIKIHPVKQGLWKACLYVPICLVSLATLGIWIWDLDCRIMSHLYADGAFPAGDMLLCKITYTFSSYPAIIVGIGCLGYLLYSLVRKQRGTGMRIALAIVLSIVVGPGLVVNTVFKDHYGRPRPRQVEMFGGEMIFHPVLIPGPYKYGRSFPSGHSSMGFIFVSGFLIGLGLRKKWAWWFLAFSLFYGSFIGLVRMAQGAHWPSDVMWSFTFVYYCSFFLTYFLGIFRPEEANP